MIKELLHIFHDSLNSFEGQKEGEEVLKLLRHHPFTIIIKLIFFFIAALAPLVVGIIFWPQISGYGAGEEFLFFISIWWLTMWISTFHALAMYCLNTIIITDRRIIDNAQIGHFNRKVSELDTARIQDVSAHTSGLIETLLDFGNVTVQTAGSENHFTFQQIPHPEKIKNIFMEITSAKHSGIKTPSI